MSCWVTWVRPSAHCLLLSNSVTYCVPDEEEMTGYTICQHAIVVVIVVHVYHSYHSQHPVSQDSVVRTPTLANLLGTQPKPASTLWTSF